MQFRGPGCALSAGAGQALNTFGLGRYLIQGARPAIHNTRGLWDNKERAQGGPQIVVTVLAGPGRCIVTAALCSKGGARARSLPGLAWLAGCGRVINAHHIPPCAPAKTRCQQLLVREELLVGGKTNPTLEIINYFARQPNIKSGCAAAPTLLPV